MSNHSLIKNSAIYALGDIVPKVLGLLVLPIMTAYLAPSQYGVIGYVNSIIMFLSIVSMLSLNTYYLVFYYRQTDEIAQRKLLGSLSFFVLGVNVALSLLLFGFGWFIFDGTGSNIAFFPFIALGVATNLMQSFSVMPTALYRLREKPLLLSMLVVLRSVLQVGLGIVFVVYFAGGALGVLWANFIVAAIFAVIFAVITYRNAILTFDWEQIRAALRFSLPLLPGSLAYYLVSLSDRLFIERFLPMADLGIYTTAANLALMLNIISYGAYKAFEPQFFKVYGTPAFGELFSRVRNGFLFVMLLGVMAVGLFAREFFMVFTSPQYHGAYFYVPMILGGVLFYAVNMLYSTAVTAAGRTKISSAIMIAGGAVSVTLNIYLLPVLGIVAATITSGISFGLMAVLSIYFSRIKINHSRPVLCVVIAAFALYVGVYAMPEQSFWLGFITKGLVFVVAASAIVLLLNIRYKKLLKIFKPK